MRALAPIQRAARSPLAALAAGCVLYALTLAALRFAGEPFPPIAFIVAALACLVLVPRAAAELAGAPRRAEPETPPQTLPPDSR